MAKTRGFYSRTGKRGRDLLNKDYNRDQKSTITTDSPTDVDDDFVIDKAKEDDGSKKTKQKKKNDPNAPKRAITGFIFFCQTERENVKKSNPGISYAEIGNELGYRWNNMTADDKAPYEAKAREDKKRYNDEISSYKNVNSADVTEGA